MRVGGVLVCGSVHIPMHKLVQLCLRRLTTAYGHDYKGDDIWNAVHLEFCAWRTECVDTIAAPFFQKIANREGAAAPLFGSSEWWACMISEKIRNYENAKRPHRVEAYLTPQNLTRLPAFDGQVDLEGEEQMVRGGSDSSGDESDGVRAREAELEQDVSHDLPSSVRNPSRKENPVSTHCGEMPFGCFL